MLRQKALIIGLVAILAGSLALLSTRGVAALGWATVPDSPVCDVNRDGRVDGLDREVLLAFYGKPTVPGGIGDINLDGRVDLLDLVEVDGCLQSVRQPDLGVALAGTPGDANGDRRVDVLDLTLVCSHYGQVGSASTAGDLNGDGVVDLLDLTLVSGNLH